MGNILTIQPPYSKELQSVNRKIHFKELKQFVIVLFYLSIITIFFPSIYKQTQ